MLGAVGRLAGGPRPGERLLDLDSDGRISDLLFATRRKKKQLRKEIVALRRLKSGLDDEVRVLQKRWRWSPARLGLSLRRNTLGRLRKAIDGLGAGR